MPPRNPRPSSALVPIRRNRVAGADSLPEARPGSVQEAVKVEHRPGRGGDPPPGEQGRDLSVVAVCRSAGLDPRHRLAAIGNQDGLAQSDPLKQSAERVSCFADTGALHNAIIARFRCTFDTSIGSRVVQQP